MSKKLLGLVAGLAIALSVAVVPVVAEEANLQDMSNEQLIALIQQLLGGSTTTTTTTTTTPATTGTSFAGIPSGFQFNTNLSQGMTGNDVKYLQIVLNSDSATAVATTGVGSAGNESTYFGSMTKAAVVKFQNKYASSILTPLGLSQGTGFVGTTTRAKLNELLAAGTSTPVSNLPAGCTSTTGFSPVTGESCSSVSTVVLPEGCTSTTGFSPVTGQSCSGTTTTPTVTPVTGAGMTVALASDSPNGTTLVTGQAIAPLAKFVLTNKDSVEAKVTTLKLQRIGVSADTTLSNVYLYNGTTRLTDAATISQGIVTFNNPNGVVTIPAGNSVTVTVASDILAGTSGQTIGVSLMNGGLTSNVEVKSTLPIQGGIQTVANATLATALVGGVTSPTGTPSVNAGTTNYTVFSAPLTIGERKVNLGGATFKVIGSIPTDALENIQLYVNGVATGDPVTIGSDNMIRFALATPVEIQSGASTLEVRANVVKGSSRNFSLSLQNAADLVITDSVYNVNVLATGIPANTGTVTISSGTVSVTTDATFNATSVTGGVSNATIAKYNFKAYGENVKISYLDVSFTGQSSLANVVIYANGAPITSNQNYTGTQLHFSLGSSLTIPAGETVSVEVRADTKTTAGVNISGTIAATLIGYTNNAQGVSSSTLSTVPSSNVAGTSLSVGTGTLTLAKNSALSDGNITPNTTNQKIGSYVIQAGSAEGARISNISVALDGTLSTTSLSNLYIKYNGVSSTPINPQASNNFSVAIELDPSESVTVDIYADVLSMGTVTNTNATGVQAFTTVNTTDAANGVAANGTITIAGTWANADTVTATIGGFPTQYTATGADTTAIAAGLAAAINNNFNVNGSVIATSNLGVVTITARSAGTAGNAITLVAAETTASDGTATASGATLGVGTGRLGTANTAQVADITPTNVEVGDIFTVVFNSTTTINFTATAASAANVVDGLVALINDNTSVNSIVTASNVGDVLHIVANVAGRTGEFTVTSSATNGTHGALGSTIQATLGMTATGVDSNSSISVATLAGQTMTTAQATLGTPTLATSSFPSKFVLAGENELVAYYNFIASTGDVIVDELRFTVNVAGTITKISVADGTPVNVINGTATLTNVGFTVPKGNSGKALKVEASYNNIDNITANAASQITLTYVKYRSGNNVTEITPISVPANEMNVVSGYPSLSVTASTDTLRNGEVKLADIKVTANGDAIKLQTLPINVTSTGVAAITNQAMVVRVNDVDVTTTGNLAVAAGGTSAADSGIITFDGTGYSIGAGQSVTFSIYATASSVAGAVNTTALATKAGAKASLKFTDIEGGVANITGEKIYNYPTNTSTIHN